MFVPESKTKCHLTKTCASGVLSSVWPELQFNKFPTVTVGRQVPRLGPQGRSFGRSFRRLVTSILSHHFSRKGSVR